MRLITVLYCPYSRLGQAGGGMVSELVENGQTLRLEPATIFLATFRWSGFTVHDVCFCPLGYSWLASTSVKPSSSPYSQHWGTSAFLQTRWNLSHHSGQALLTRRRQNPDADQRLKLRQLRICIQMWDHSTADQPAGLAKSLGP